MQAFKEKVQSLINKHEEQLTANGVKVTISKKYFETEVGERSTSYTYNGAAIFGIIDRAVDRKREKKNKYNYERNRYHCIVLSILPIDKNIIQKGLCREYGFVLRKVERAHIGQEPQRIQHDEEKVLSKIERRILKILKKVEKHSTKTVCKDTLIDAIRYTAPKYGYKEKVLGKERSTWELIFILVIGILAVSFVLAGWGISNLF